MPVFKLDINPTFRCTVDITVPGGGVRPLKVVFRHKTRSQLAAWLEDKSQTNAAMVEEIVAEVEEKPEGQTDAEFFAVLFENFPASAMDVYLTYRRELEGSRAKK